MKVQLTERNRIVVAVAFDDGQNDFQKQESVVASFLRKYSKIVEYYT